MSTESARNESFERQHTSIAQRNREKVIREARSKGLRVGLHLFSRWLWWSKALLNFKSPWIPPLAGKCFVDCAGFCTKKVRPLRRSPPEGSNASKVHSRPGDAEKPARQARATATTTCLKAAKVMLSITQRSKGPRQTWGVLQKRITHKDTELCVTAECSNMTPSSY